MIYLIRTVQYHKNYWHGLQRRSMPWRNRKASVRKEVGVLYQMERAEPSIERYAASASAESDKYAVVFSATRSIFCHNLTTIRRLYIPMRHETRGGCSMRNERFLL